MLVLMLLILLDLFLKSLNLDDLNGCKLYHLYYLSQQFQSFLQIRNQWYFHSLLQLFLQYSTLYLFRQSQIVFVCFLNIHMKLCFRLYRLLMIVYRSNHKSMFLYLSHHFQYLDYRYYRKYKYYLCMMLQLVGMLHSHKCRYHYCEI